YHLIPLASQLRARGVDNRIGFFLHTPLAAAELLTSLPHHQEIFGSFSAYDLIGVQTSQDLLSLREYFQRVIGADLKGDGIIALPDGHQFRAGHFPISIDTTGAQAIARAAADSEPT